MKYIFILVLALTVGVTTVSAAAPAIKKMQVTDNITSKINKLSYYEKMVDASTGVTCYTFINTSIGVSISCVKA